MTAKHTVGCPDPGESLGRHKVCPCPYCLDTGYIDANPDEVDCDCGAECAPVEERDAECDLVNNRLVRKQLSFVPGVGVTMTTRIVSASTNAVEELRPYVDKVLAAVAKVTGQQGALGAWVSDESALSDFFDYTRDRSQDHELFARLGEQMGIRLDPANKDDRMIVKVARRLKLETTS